MMLRENKGDDRTMSHQHQQQNQMTEVKVVLASKAKTGARDDYFNTKEARMSAIGVRIRRARAGLAAGAGAAALVLITASPAQAHPTSASLPFGIGHGGVHTGHTWVYACDDRADGRGVRVHYWLRSGGVDTVGDPNGSASPCGGRTVSSTRNPVVFFEVCAGKDGRDDICTGRQNA